MNTVSIEGDYRYIVVVEWDKRDVANQFAADWCPNPRGDETFGAVRLSADGTEPPSHTACNTLTDDDECAEGGGEMAALHRCHTPDMRAAVIRARPRRTGPSSNERADSHTAITTKHQ